MLKRLVFRLRIRALLCQGRHDIARSHQCERWAEEAVGRAEVRLAEARALAARAGFRPTP